MCCGSFLFMRVCECGNDAALGVNLMPDINSHIAKAIQYQHSAEMFAEFARACMIEGASPFYAFPADYTWSDDAIYWQMESAYASRWARHYLGEALAGVR